MATSKKYLIYETSKWRFSIKNVEEWNVISQNLLFNELSWKEDIANSILYLAEEDMNVENSLNQKMNEKNCDESILVKFFTQRYNKIFWIDIDSNNQYIDIESNEQEDVDEIFEKIKDNIDYIYNYWFEDYVQEYLEDSAWLDYNWIHWKWINVKLYNLIWLNSFDIDEVIEKWIISQDSLEKINEIWNVKWKNIKDLEDVLNILNNWEDIKADIDNNLWENINSFAETFLEEDDQIVEYVKCSTSMKFWESSYEWKNWWYLIPWFQIDTYSLFPNFEEIQNELENDSEINKRKFIEKVQNLENNEWKAYINLDPKECDLFEKDFVFLSKIVERIKELKRYIETDFAKEVIWDYIKDELNLNDEIDKEYEMLYSWIKEFEWKNIALKNLLSCWINDLIRISNFRWTKYQIQELFENEKFEKKYNMNVFHYPYFWTWHKEFLNFLNNKYYWNYSDSYDTIIKWLFNNKWINFDNIKDKEIKRTYSDILKNKEFEFIKFKEVKDKNSFFKILIEKNWKIKNENIIKNFVKSYSDNWVVDFLNKEFTDSINEDLWVDITNELNQWEIIKLTKVFNIDMKKTISKLIDEFNEINDIYYDVNKEIDNWKFLAKILKKYNIANSEDIKEFKNLWWNYNQFHIYERIIKD